ncbi:MAG: GtrA family protein [Acidobacteriaceae bacterium]|nr:GtrA family protein [Acidobacteriaceae bacterium]
MRPSVRITRFLAVGLLGFSLQIVLLEILHRYLHWNDLLATAIALEATLLHNFYWHRRFTWKSNGPLPVQLYRFHLTNGLFAFTANLLLISWWTRLFHMPIVLATTLSAMLCSSANFAFCQLWTFATATPRHTPNTSSTPLFP